MARVSEGRKVIRSHAELHRLLPRLFAQQDQHPQLAIAALANPILALEELGYELAPEIALHMQRLARFGAARTAEIEGIEADLRKELGPDAPIDDRHRLARAVIVRLPDELLDADFPEETLMPKAALAPASDEAKPRFIKDEVPSRPLAIRDRLGPLLAEPPQRRFDSPTQPPDPLAVLRGRAPLLDAMIRLREIEGSRARLAEPEVFHGILDRRIATPITRVRFRPSASAPPEG